MDPARFPVPCSTALRRESKLSMRVIFGACLKHHPGVSVSIYHMLHVSIAGGGDSTAASDQKHEDGPCRRLRSAAGRASLLLG
jgi:hypothetical protein